MQPWCRGRGGGKTGERKSDLLQGEAQGSLAALLKTTGGGSAFQVQGPEVSGVESSFFEIRTKEKQCLTTTVEIPSLMRISPIWLVHIQSVLRINAQV